MNSDSDTKVIDVGVARLRATLYEPFEPKLLRTLHGMGYVREIPEPF